MVHFPALHLQPMPSKGFPSRSILLEMPIALRMKPERIHRGHFSANVYRERRAGGTRYELRWREEISSDGKNTQVTRRKKFADRPALLLHVELKAAEVNNGTSSWNRLTPAVRNELELAHQTAQTLGKAVLQIVYEEKARIEAAAQLSGPSGASVTELVERFIGAKRAEGIGDYYLRDFGARLGRFARDFQTPLASVTVGDVEAWLDGLKVAPRTWNNFLAAIRSLATFCKKRKLVPVGWDLDGIELRKIAWKRPEIFTPEEMRTLLDAANPGLARCLALSAFAGLRTEEVSIIRWEDFHWDEGWIHVSEEVAKTRQHCPPILDVLRAWIPTIEARGQFSPYKDAKSLSGMKVNLLARLKMEPRRNALRKSWISYRLAVIRNEAQVADEAGTSVQDIHRHYLNRPSLLDAQKWFGIRPQFVPTNVIQGALVGIL
jgi:integrase